MSTVIRDAVIRLKLEHQKAKLEAPDIGPATRAHEEHKKAALETAKAQREVAGAVKESGEATKKSAETSSIAILDYKRVHAQSSEQILRNFREGGEGALRMARGIAFLSASGSEDMRKLLQTVMIAQGGFDVAAGGLKVFTNLARVASPQAAAGITLVTAAVTAGGLAWSKYRREAAEALKAVSEEAKKLRAEIGETESAQNRLTRTMAALREASQVTPELAAEARANELWRLRREGGRPESDAGRTLLGGALRDMQGRGPLGAPGEIPILRDAARSRPDLVREQLRLEQELSSSLRDRITLETEVGKREAERARGHTAGIAAQLGIATMNAPFLLAPEMERVGARLTGEAGIRERETIQQLQGTIDKIVNAFERAAERIDRLERGLSAANPD